MQIILTDSIYINGIELTEEVPAVYATLGKKERISKILELNTNLKFAPNLSVSLRILFTILVSVASEESSFSYLELMKSF